LRCSPSLWDWENRHSNNPTRHLHTPIERSVPYEERRPNPLREPVVASYLHITLLYRRNATRRVKGGKAITHLYREKGLVIPRYLAMTLVYRRNAIPHLVRERHFLMTLVYRRNAIRRVKGGKHLLTLIRPAFPSTLKVRH
jgi:hypothetical protein